MKDEKVKVATEAEEEVDEDIVQLVNEDGETADFYHVATLDFEGKWYVVFQPAEEMEEVDEEEVVLFELQADENGEDVFAPIEDEAVLEKVYNAYIELISSDECGCGENCDCDGECGGEDHCDCGKEEHKCDDKGCHCKD